MREIGNHTDDQSVWLRMQQGDSQALADLYDRYANILYNYGKGFTSRSETVEDAIQDLLTEVWVKRHKLTVPYSVKGYLIKSLRQKLLRLLTQEKRWQLVNDYSSFSLVDSHLSVVHESFDGNQELRRELQQAISTLSSRQQEAIILKYTENLTHQEIAEIMNIKIQTLYNLFHTAIQKLSRNIQNKPHPVHSFLLLL